MAPELVELTELHQQLQDPSSDGGGKWVNLKEQDLSSLPNLKSEGGDTETAIIFMNSTKAEIAYYWVDYEGNEKFYGNIAPNAFVNQHTYVGPYLAHQRRERAEPRCIPRREKNGTINYCHRARGCPRRRK